MKSKISGALKEAMKNRDKQRVSVLRMMTAQLSLADTSGQEPDYVAALASYAKKLAKAAEEYEGLGRADTAATVRDELAIVQEFLPQKLSDADTEALVDRILAEHELGPRDVGKAMKLVMSEHRDVVDGKQVRELVKAKLTGA